MAHLINMKIIYKQGKLYNENKTDGDDSFSRVFAKKENDLGHRSQEQSLFALTDDFHFNLPDSAVLTGEGSVDQPHWPIIPLGLRVFQQDDVSFLQVWFLSCPLATCL